MAMLCTASVEEVIESHYEKQLEKIGLDEKELKEKIKKFKKDETMHKNMKGEVSYNLDGVYGTVNIDNLPNKMDVEILLDIGENSNINTITKLGKVGAEILPALNQQGVGMVIKPEAPAVLATKLIEAMNLDSNDFLEDYTTDEFKQKAAEQIQKIIHDANKKVFGVKVGVDKTGCSGYAYKLDYALVEENSHSDDAID